VEISYDELDKRLKSMLNDSSMEKKVRNAMSEYLKLPGTKIFTDNEFIKKCFYNYFAFKDLMLDNNSTAFTILACMGTVMKVSHSTACLPLSLLNDEGYLAFCESDFSVIPSGILLHYISGRPVFLCNPTTPHQNIVMCAHCTSPRRMDGEFVEPADIVTHYESDFGAAIKAYYKKNQKVTLIDPDSAQIRWLGMEGVVTANPSVAACRSQHEIMVEGDTDFLFREMRGNHWMLAYGSWTREVGYACRKLGMDWLNISDISKFYQSRKYTNIINPGNTFDQFNNKG
jgi:L-fucose isomerase-like protein